MGRHLLMLTLFCFFSLISFSQENNQFEKECRISSGIGLAGITKNLKSLGMDVWVQLDYKVHRKFSIATEFENMVYKQPGYYLNVPFSPNQINAFNNDFSLLLKYHFISTKKLQLSLASGWTYSTRTTQYYSYHSNGNSTEWSIYINSYNDYRIPFLAQAEYPFSKKLNLVTRLKYSLNPENGNNFSGGLGLSLKL